MDYFTDRQDRYHLFSSKDITDHFWNIHNAVGKFSFLLQPEDSPAGFTLTWPSNNTAPSPLEAPAAFITATTKTLQPLISPALQEKKNGEVKDTRVYMLAQMSQLMKPDTSTELPAVSSILNTLSRPEYKLSSWTFTAGYFNPAPSLTKLLLNTASTDNTVITAAPEANGFYKSPGVSGLLPGAYTLLARRFLTAIQAHATASITLQEWRRGTVAQPGGWSYHAKGLWITLPNEKNPAVSIIGSSNYTKRSYALDLEVGALIVTRDDALMRRLGEEVGRLGEHAKSVTQDDFCKNERRVGIRVRVAMWLVKVLGGQL